MSAARLVLIEGMIGSGKTTLAGCLESWLSERDYPVRAFGEFAEDHPIRTRAVDQLRGARPSDAPHGETGRGPDVYAVAQWRRLAERCCREHQTVILESTFLQNSVMPAFIGGAPDRTVARLFTEIMEQAAPAEPLLAYLRPTDIQAAIARVYQARGEPWVSGNVAFVEDSPWARRRDLRGQQAVVRLYQEWEALASSLYRQYWFPKLMLTDPQESRSATLSRLSAAVLAPDQQPREDPAVPG